MTTRSCEDGAMQKKIDESEYEAVYECEERESAVKRKKNE